MKFEAFCNRLVSDSCVFRGWRAKAKRVGQQNEPRISVVKPLFGGDFRLFAFGRTVAPMLMREIRVLESVPLPASGRNRTSSGQKRVSRRIRRSGLPASSVGVETAARPNGKGEACGGEPFATADGSGSFIEGGRSAVMRLLPIYCNSGKPPVSRENKIFNFFF